MKFTRSFLVHAILLLSLPNKIFGVDNANNDVVPSKFQKDKGTELNNDIYEHDPMLSKIEKREKISDDKFSSLSEPKPGANPMLANEVLLKRSIKKEDDRISKENNNDVNDLMEAVDDDIEAGYLEYSKPILFTVGTSDAGLKWNQIPFREKFQWHIPDAPCHPFRMRVPDERANKSVIEVCVYRDHLDFEDDSLVIVHSHDTIYDSESQKEVKVSGQVNGALVSTVTGRLVDTFFYGEISVQDPDTKETLVFVVEEISLLSKLIRHNEKIMRNLLAVMNSKITKSGPPVKYNAVITEGVSILSFMTHEKLLYGTPIPILIFSTGHNSYITSGDAKMDVEDDGRITFSARGNDVSFNTDGSVLFMTGKKKYTFRPYGETSLTEGVHVQKIQEHEGSLALSAFTSSLTFGCMLPTPAFDIQKKGGYLCKVCLTSDSHFEKYFKKNHQQGLDSSIDFLGHVIDKVSWIFRSIDWNNDKVPDNVGLDWDNQFVEWSYSDNGQETVTEDDLDNLFQSLATIDFSECCLGIAYTMKKFPVAVYAKSTSTKSVLNGGVCAVRSQGLSNNIILISANNKKGNYSALTEDQLVYLTAHEIAKSFGASADITGKSECDQFKEKNNTVRHFLLWPDIMRNVVASERTFSSCSKLEITETLSSCKSACFDRDMHPFCGNGIVEASEECDCGSESNCLLQKCCHSRNNKYPCRKTGIACAKHSAATRWAARALTLTVFFAEYVMNIAVILLVW